MTYAAASGMQPLVLQRLEELCPAVWLLLGYLLPENLIRLFPQLADC